MTEKQLLEAVRELAKHTGWLVYHTHDSRRSEPGFPDLVLCHRRHPWLMIAELKVGTGRLTDAQRQWYRRLVSWWPDDDRTHVAVWTDADWRDGRIEHLLTEGP